MTPAETDRVLRAVALWFFTTPAQIVGHQRGVEITRAKYAVALVMRRRGALHKQIAAALNYADESSTRRAVRFATRWHRDNVDRFRDACDLIEGEITT